MITSSLVINTILDWFKEWWDWSMLLIAYGPDSYSSLFLTDRVQHVVLAGTLLFNRALLQCVYFLALPSHLL